MRADWLMLILCAAAAADVAFTFLRARRLRNEKQLLKAEITKWEDEGGNVPQVPTVSPAAKPESSRPARR